MISVLNKDKEEDQDYNNLRIDTGHVDADNRSLRENKKNGITKIKKPKMMLLLLEFFVI